MSGWGRFLAALCVAALLSAGLWRSEAGAFGETSFFRFAQIRYEGPTWSPNPTAGSELVSFVGRYTSIRVAPTRKEILLSDSDLFSYPFLYLTGCGAIPRFSDADVQRLRRHLLFGGTLLADDCLADPEGPFAKSVAELAARLFPGKTLEPLPKDHTIFQTYFLLHGRISGRKMSAQSLSGVTVDGRTVVIYSPNDLGGAWAKSYGGEWSHACEPGGEGQRQLAFRLGLNLVMYSLTVDYKKDTVHLPFILKRRR